MPHDAPASRAPAPRRIAVAALVAVATLAGGAIVAAQTRGFRAPVAAGEAPAAGLWVSTTPLDDGRQLLLIVDPAARQAAVYHVDGAAGTLTLRSTRAIAWDLLVPEFNAQEPRPTALRKLVEAGEPVPPGAERRDRQ
ncbi:MAG: hypothetical protein ACKO5R_06400 [Planctomycetaceae bacterium]